MCVLRLLTIATLYSALLLAADPPEDPATILAQILAQKGAITGAELAQVQNAVAQNRVAILAAILREKGVLDSSDLAKLSVPATTPVAAATPRTPAIVAQGPSSASPAAPTTVAASSPNSPSAPQQAKAAQPAEANAGKHVPVTLYGTLLFNAGFNTAGINLEDAGSIAAKPGSSLIAGDQSFYATPRQTRVGMRLDPIAVGDADLTGVFEMDAYSADAPFANGANMGLFRLRLAYGRLDWQNVAIEIGQDWSIFAPLNPSSLAMYGVPELSGAGNPWIRLPQIRLEAKKTLSSSSRLLYQIAASDPNDGDYPATFIGTRPPGAGELGRMPAIESRLAWTLSEGDRDYTLGFSGRYGRGRNIAPIGNNAVIQPVDSWGAAVDYSLPFTRVFNLTGEAYIGRALGIYNVAAAEDIGAVGTLGGHGVLSRGGWLQTQFNLDKQWQLNAGYGIDNPEARDLLIGARDRNQNYFGNFIYKWTPNVNLSLEYRRLLTAFRNQPNATARANLFTLSAAYLF